MSASTKAGASVAGIGAGTTLVALAQSMPDENVWKPLLLIAAPTASVIAGGFWIWFRVAVEEKIQERKINVIFERFRRKLQAAIDAAPTPEHKRLLQERMVEANMIMADHGIRLLQALAPISTNKKNQTEALRLALKGIGLD